LQNKQQPLSSYQSERHDIGASACNCQLLDMTLVSAVAARLLQDYYKAVMAEMYVDGAGMRGGGGNRVGGGQYGGQHYGGGQGYSNGGRPAEAAGAGNGYEAGPSNVLRLRGLPFSAQKEDIVRWFEDVAPLAVDK
jgi:hypothetical protein